MARAGRVSSSSMPGGEAKELGEADESVALMTWERTPTSVLHGDEDPL